MAPTTTTTSLLLSNPIFLKGLAAANAFALTTVGGAALSMYAFIIPIIVNSSGGSSKTMLRQFHHLITLGARYMQTANRAQALTLPMLSYLLWRQEGDGSVRWRWFAGAWFVAIQAAWWEIYFIFWINDRLVGMESEVEKNGRDGDGDGREEVREEVVRLLELWRSRHVVRTLCPIVGAALAIWGCLW